MPGRLHVLQFGRIQQWTLVPHLADVRQERRGLRRTMLARFGLRLSANLRPWILQRRVVYQERRMPGPHLRRRLRRRERATVDVLGRDLPLGV